MNRKTIAVAAPTALLAAIPVVAVSRQDDAPARTLAYGSAPLQQADFWPGARGNAPLVLFVHGGGWKRGDMRMMAGSAKLADWQAKGYAVASTNYRLVPDATVEQQAQDVAGALAYFRSHAATLGIDPARIVLVGHSAGAHLVALVGTDPQYLRAASLAPDAVAGVIALDGAAYDVPAQMGENARLMGDTYRLRHRSGAPARLVPHLPRALPQRSRFPHPPRPAR